MTKNEAIIREARLEDLPLIKKIVERAYAVYLPRMDKKPFPMLEDYRARLADGLLFVIEADEGIVGYIVLLPHGDGALLLDNIGVDPEVQGKGYGAELLAFAEREARRMGGDAIIVYTNEAMVENIGWYEKHGYLVQERRIEDGYRRIYFAKKLKERELED